MKKYVTFLLSLVLFATTYGVVSAKASTGSSLADAIKLYKAGNYTASYEILSEVVKNDPSNAVAYYYLAIASVQVGKQEEAISNYEKVLSLTPDGKLGVYASKGKTCLETPEECNASDASGLDSFIQSKFGNGLSSEVNIQFEEKKLENLKREMNRKNDLTPNRFKDFRDYSSELPTNDEIVMALRTLQKAGLSDILGGQNNYSSDISMLFGNQNSDSNAMLNMLMGGANSSLSPQVIQSLLTNQMTTNF